MPLSDLISMATAQHWLPLIALLTLIVRRWTAEDSKFPVTIAPAWRSTVSAIGGLVYGFVSALQQGTSWGTALLTMASLAGASGFLDGLATAMFSQGAPRWARAIVFIFDDLTKGSPAAPAQKAVSIKPPTPEVKPPQASRWILSPVRAFQIPAFACLAAIAVSACLTSAPNLPSDVGGAVACVLADAIEARPVTDCIDKYGPQLVADAISILEHSKTTTKEHPELTPRLASYRAAMGASK